MKKSKGALSDHGYDDLKRSKSGNNDNSLLTSLLVPAEKGANGLT